MRNVLGLAASIALVVTTPSWAGAWSPRGVFAFDGIALDFERGAYKADFDQGPLADCSTAEFYCAQSTVVALVLPRACAALDKGDWSVNGIRTHVLWKGPPPGGGDPRIAPVVYLLGDEARPHIVYRYTEPTGIQSVYFDRKSQLDLVAMAKADGLKDLTQRIVADPLLGYQLHRGLVTMDMFGNCSRPL